MRALVISGGGSKGAFAGGVAEFLLTERQKQYELFIGTSTGSLMVPLLAIGEIDKLKRVYTTVTESDIFSTCPFIMRKEDGAYKLKINHLGILWLFIKGKKTFGDSTKLRRLISSVITVDDFQKIQSNDSDIIVTVSNLSCNTVEHKSMKDCTYEDFCDWVWISSNLVPFMSLVRKNGYDYADGGIGDLVPVHEAIRRGATEIDVIVLSPVNADCKHVDVGNAFELTLKVFGFMLNQITTDDINIGKIEGQHRELNINFYHTPRVLTRHSLVFDPEEMSQWWEEGFEYAKTTPPIHCCVEIPAL